jgi:hypothetical protein
MRNARLAGHIGHLRVGLKYLSTCLKGFQFATIIFLKNGLNKFGRKKPIKIISEAVLMTYVQLQHFEFEIY